MSDAPTAAAEPEVTDETPPPASGLQPATDAVANAIATVGQQSAIADEATAAANGVKPSPPADRPLPFPAPAFDPERALEQIERANHRVASCKRQWEEDKETVAGSKKLYDKAVDDLNALIRRVEGERRDAERLAQQPLLAPVPETAPTSAPTPGCAYEAKTGQPCPICRRTPVAEAFASTELHLDDAQDAASAWTDEDLRSRLEAADVFIDATVTTTWTPEQRADVQAWAAERAGETLPEQHVLPWPAALGTPHLAAAPGDTLQCCDTCGVVLASTPEDFYGKGAKVGTDCPGALEGNA